MSVRPSRSQTPNLRILVRQRATRSAAVTELAAPTGNEEARGDAYLMRRRRGERYVPLT